MRKKILFRAEKELERNYEHGLLIISTMIVVVRKEEIDKIRGITANKMYTYLERTGHRKNESRVKKFDEKYLGEVSDSRLKDNSINEHFKNLGYTVF